MSGSDITRFAQYKDFKDGKWFTSSFVLISLCLPTQIMPLSLLKYYYFKLVFFLAWQVLCFWVCSWWTLDQVWKGCHQTVDTLAMSQVNGDWGDSFPISTHTWAVKNDPTKDNFHTYSMCLHSGCLNWPPQFFLIGVLSSCSTSKIFSDLSQLFHL